MAVAGDGARKARPLLLAVIVLSWAASFAVRAVRDAARRKDGAGRRG